MVHSAASCFEVAVGLFRGSFLGTCSFLRVIAVARPHQIAQDDLDTLPYIFQADLSICTSFAV